MAQKREHCRQLLVEIYAKARSAHLFTSRTRMNLQFRNVCQRSCDGGDLLEVQGDRGIAAKPFGAPAATLCPTHRLVGQPCSCSGTALQRLEQLAAARRCVAYALPHAPPCWSRAAVVWHADTGGSKRWFMSAIDSAALLTWRWAPTVASGPDPAVEGGLSPRPPCYQSSPVAEFAPAQLAPQSTCMGTL